MAMPTVRRSIDEVIGFLDGQLKELDDDLGWRLRESPAVAGAGGAAEERTWYRSGDHHQPAGGIYRSWEPLTGEGLRRWWRWHR